MGVAQLVECLTVTQVVEGSSPFTHPIIDNARLPYSVSPSDRVGLGGEHCYLKILFSARVAELVDALVLGTSVL